MEFRADTLVIALGSNYQPQQSIRLALSKLSVHFGQLTLSPAYWSKAVKVSGNDFINLLVVTKISHSLATTRRLLKGIERQLNENVKARIIDLDLILFGTQTDAHLPHADALNYRFIAQPLADLFPQGYYPHSVLKQRLFKKLSFNEKALQLSQQMRLIPTAFLD